MTASTRWTGALKAAPASIVQWLFKLGHQSFALAGFALAFCALALTTQPDLRQTLENRVTSWLQGRQLDLLGMEVRPDAVERATAINPKDLPKPQAAVAYWLAERYRVAPEPLGALVAEAYQIGNKTKVEPTLLLAIMAIESGFNPFAQSPVGAQGLMQVMTRVHTEKYENFGGIHAAFDPVTNLRVGAKVLRDCVARAGSLEGGLKQYVGAANSGNDGGYVIKVMAEFGRLQQVADGKTVPVFQTQQVAVVSIPAALASPMLMTAESANVNATLPPPAVRPTGATSHVKTQLPLPTVLPGQNKSARDDKLAANF